MNEDQASYHDQNQEENLEEEHIVGETGDIGGIGEDSQDENVFLTQAQTSC